MKIFSPQIAAKRQKHVATGVSLWFNGIKKVAVDTATEKINLSSFHDSIFYVTLTTGLRLWLHAFAAFAAKFGKKNLQISKELNDALIGCV